MKNNGKIKETATTKFPRIHNKCVLSNKKWLIKKRRFENNSIKYTRTWTCWEIRAKSFHPFSQFLFFSSSYLGCCFFCAINPFTLMSTHTFFSSLSVDELNGVRVQIFMFFCVCGAQPSFFFQRFLLTCLYVGKNTLFKTHTHTHTKLKCLKRGESEHMLCYALLTSGVVA